MDSISVSDYLKPYIDNLGNKLQRYINIVREYPQTSQAKVDTVISRIRKVDNDVTSAIVRGTNDRIIANHIEKFYIPFADKMYDHLRWSMNNIRST